LSLELGYKVLLSGTATSYQLLKTNWMLRIRHSLIRGRIPPLLVIVAMSPFSNISDGKLT
jgi:hypothetical protein